MASWADMELNATKHEISQVPILSQKSISSENSSKKTTFSKISRMVQLDSSLLLNEFSDLGFESKFHLRVMLVKEIMPWIGILLSNEAVDVRKSKILFQNFDIIIIIIIYCKIIKYSTNTKRILSKF